MKDAYYFPHDANAQNDPNIIKLLYKHSWAGYGLYWSIIEKLRNEPDYTMETDYDMIAYALRVDADKIKSIIEDFNLFIIEKGYFYSESLKRRMSRLDAIKEKRAYAGKMSGISRNQTKSEQPSNNSATGVEQVLNSKEKHSKKQHIKLNKIKEKNITIRENNFRELVNSFSGKYAPKLLTAFADHWTEPSQGGLKMKCEMEKTFEIGRRLSTWSRNDFEGFQKEWVRERSEKKNIKDLKEREKAAELNGDTDPEEFKKFFEGVKSQIINKK